MGSVVGRWSKASRASVENGVDAGDAGNAGNAGDAGDAERPLALQVGFVDGSEMVLTLPGVTLRSVTGRRSLEDLLLQLGKQLDYPPKHLVLTLDSRSFSADDWEKSLEELGIHEASRLLCVKTSPLSRALPASTHFARATAPSASSDQVSLYFELAAEGWRDFPWRGPVDIALNATVGDLWEDAQRILMEVADAWWKLGRQEAERESLTSRHRHAVPFFGGGGAAAAPVQPPLRPAPTADDAHVGHAFAGALPSEGDPYPCAHPWQARAGRVQESAGRATLPFGRCFERWGLLPSVLGIGLVSQEAAPASLNWARCDLHALPGTAGHVSIDHCSQHLTAITAWPVV
ncbi:unnamed protein product [Symbiodinium natans]|uniref:Uncharacterized protein n=1 Tax=Symbiodinium natans TaxID=878477 RepID=A0A812U2V4_9DINO|nr:unnamed protein product [Symbiodinium natans]